MKTTALLKQDMTPVVSPASSQVFLFSKTLSPSGKRTALPHLPELPALVWPGEVQEAFSNAFPGIRIGQAFVDEAIKQMGTQGFSVLMIRPDSRFDPEGAETFVDPFLFNAGFILDQLVRPLHAMWGLAGPDTLGCFLAETDPAICRSFAAEIQNSLSEFQLETVSIGIAVHPMAGFHRDETVLNALKALTHASVAGPGSTVVLDAVSLNISGDQLYQAGNLPGAVEEYRRALELDPSNVNVHNSLGVCYGMMERYEAAEAEFDATLLLRPDEVMALYNLGVVCLMTGRKETALDNLLKAGAIDDGIFEPAILTGKLYLEAGSPEKARPFLEKALRCRPKSGTALRTLGACLSALDLPREAVSVYTRAIRNNPGDAESLSRLGLLYETIGENPEIARVFCRQSVAIAPENAVYRERLEGLMRK